MHASSDAIVVLGISGSLRKDSFNTALLRAAVALAPPSMTIEEADIRDVPLYDEDTRTRGWPPAVERLRSRLAAADAVLIVTPEYNYSIPGVLKNAIDWVSRGERQPLADKPLAIMGASGGLSGTMRAQYDLRKIAVFLDMHPLNKPEVFVRSAAEKFESGVLVDEPTKKVVAAQLEALATWTRRLKRGSAA
jgi:chromate reductase